MDDSYEYHLDAVNDCGVGVRVAFQRIGDRYGHTIFGIRKDRIDAVATSVEDEHSQGWPLSPPVQELRDLADSERGRSLMLIGSAAAGHWSASVRVLASDKGNPSLEFDIAVRLSRLPHLLGVTYQTLDDASWIGDPGSGLAFLKLDCHALVISPPLSDDEDDMTSPSELIKAFPVEHAENRRMLLPATGLPSCYPATYRWRYWITAALG